VLRSLKGRELSAYISSISLLLVSFELFLTDMLDESLFLAEQLSEGSVNQAQLGQQKALLRLADRVRKLLDLQATFQLTVSDVCWALAVDRTGIFRFDPDSGYTQGSFISESAAPGLSPALATQLQHHCFDEQAILHLQSGGIQAMTDIYASTLPDRLIQNLESLGVRAVLSVPILQANRLWGLLCFYQEKTPRQWQPDEAIFAQLIAQQLAIALHQSELTEKLRQQQSALEANQQRLLCLVQQSPLAIIEWDTEFRVISWNETAKHTFGYSQEEAIGRHAAEFIVPHAVEDQVNPMFAELLQQQDGYHSISENITKTGETIIGKWHNVPLVNQAGEVVSILSMVHDITEQIRIEKERQQVEAERDRLFQISVDVMAIASLDGYFIRINPAFSKVLGYSEADILNRPFLDLVHPDDIKSTLAEMAVLKAGKDSLAFENRYRCKDGSYRWLAWASRIGIDDGLVFATARDITEQKQMEAEQKAAEAEIQAQALQLKAINASVPGMIYQYTTDLRTGEGRFTYVSPGVVSLCELDIETVLNDPIKVWAMVHPDDIQAVVAKSINVNQNCLSWFDEFRIITPSGKLKWIRGQAEPAASADGFVIHNGVMLDITELKQAEATLRQSEQNLRTIFNGVYDALFIHDMDGNILDVNERTLQMYGLTYDQAISYTIADYLQPDSLPDQLPEIWQRVSTGESVQFEWKGRRPSDDVYFDAEVILQHLVLGDQKVVLAAVRDITERKQADQTLQQSRDQLDAIINHIPAAIYLKDLQGRYLLINQTCLDLFNAQREHFVGQTDHDLFAKEMADELRKTDLDTLAAKTPIEREEVILTKSGLRTFTAIKFPLLNPEGNPCGLCGISIDVTEREQARLALEKSEAYSREQAELAMAKSKELEAALAKLTRTQAQLVQNEKMSSLGQLMAGIAHEINNPVNFIHGNINHVSTYAEDLIDLVNLYQQTYPQPKPDIVSRIEDIDLEFLNEDLPKLLDSMKLGTSRIREIVRSLRIFSRLDEAEVKAVDIHEGIDSTLMILQSRLKAKPDRPEILVIKNYGILPLVECYAGQLNQVFMNILANAIDALEERDQQSSLEAIKQVPSQITITTELDQENWVAIRIADNGLGIPDEIGRRLFDPFFTTKPVGKGTGMGLSISYQIITEKHQGTLTYTSAIDCGTEFLIRIPLHQNNLGS